MNTTIEERKQKALEYLKKLNICKSYITDFEKDNTVCYDKTNKKNTKRYVTKNKRVR